MIALEREASLRVEPGTRVEIACLSGVVWITHAGDARDLFLAPGESLVLPPRGVTLMTALEPATVRVVDCAAQRQLRCGGGPASRAPSAVCCVGQDLQPGPRLLSSRTPLSPGSVASALTVVVIAPRLEVRRADAGAAQALSD